MRGLIVTRLLVRLKASNDTKYERGHNKEVQGLIYHILDNSSEYGRLHDRQGCKFFSFTNIFPFHDLRQGDSRSLLISSPSNRLITYLKQQLEYLSEIKIGAMRFKINYCEKFDIILSKLDSWFSLITITPIISRIQAYRRNEEMKTKTCWSTDQSPDLFISQLQSNLVKKFNSYHHLLQFALDCGLGELNSLGFGFVNVLDSQGRTVTSN